MENSLLVIFDEIWPMTMYYKYRDFDAILDPDVQYSTKRLLLHISLTSVLVISTVRWSSIHLSTTNVSSIK